MFTTKEDFHSDVEGNFVKERDKLGRRAKFVKLKMSNEPKSSILSTSVCTVGNFIKVVMKMLPTSFQVYYFVF